MSRAERFTVDQVRDLARATRKLEEIAFNATTCVVSFRSRATHARIDVYYTAGTIGVTPAPTRGGGARRQVFRRDCDLVDMLKVFSDPEVNLGKEYTVVAEGTSRRRRRRRGPRRNKAPDARSPYEQLAAGMVASTSPASSGCPENGSGSDTRAGAGAPTAERTCGLLRGVRVTTDFTDPVKEEDFLRDFRESCGEISMYGGYVICFDDEKPRCYYAPKELENAIDRRPHSSPGAQSVALGCDDRWFVQWQDGTHDANHESKEFLEACRDAEGHMQVSFGPCRESWAIVCDLGCGLGRACPWQLFVALEREFPERGEPTQIRLGFEGEWFAMWSDGFFEYGNLPVYSRLPDRLRELQAAGATIRTILFVEDGDWLVRYNYPDDA